MMDPRVRPNRGALGYELMSNAGAQSERDIGDEDREMAAARQRSLDSLVASDSDLKLVVAGPGTGKTYTFRKLLRTRGEPRLVLTFINNLVSDLEGKLGDIAEVRTLHRFCRRLLHSNLPRGLTPNFDYFPALTEMLAADASVLLDAKLSIWDIEAVMHTLDGENDILGCALQSGDYYDAVGHTDAVYRLVRYFDEHPDNIPVYAQIVVDEFQDFSALEVRFIEQLSARSPILVVGDDDQALYEFKHASPEHLRRLAREGEFERFDLPYCTRCTQVLVESVGDVVEGAQALGLLEGRVRKPFECYTPEKRSDSHRYPSILHARTTRQDRKAPYMGMYIDQQVGMIPEEEIREAREKGHPTVLVTGPAQFAGQIYDYLVERFEQVEYRRRDPSEMSLLDGYLRLLVNEGSRLGWRILMSVERPNGFDEIIRQAFGDGRELADLLPDEYRQGHLAVLILLRKVRDEIPLADDEAWELEEAIGIALPDLERVLRVSPPPQEETEEEQELSPAEVPQGPEDEDEAVAPQIVVTNLVGAKGLQASHVFIAGLNEQHFPRSNADPTDKEICELIVALTRATKRCHLLSCQRFGGQPAEPSVFVEWLAGRLQMIEVNADYFR